MATITIEETTNGLNITEQTTTLKLGEYAVFSGDINDLNQVETTSLADGDLLQYNSTSGVFENVSEDVLNIEKGSLTKTFTTSEEYTWSLDSAVTGVPIVSATKDIAGVTDTDATWNVETSGGDYDVEDFALDTTLTPSATTGEITLTLGAGAFTADNVGMTISGNGGVCVLTATDGSATVTTDFTDTSAIASGSWTMKGLVFDATNGVTISVATAQVSYPTVNGITYDSKSFSTTSEMTDPWGVKFNPSVTKMYVVDYSETIYQYTLSTSGDISTASYDSKSFNASAQDTVMRNPPIFNNDGTKMYLVGYTNKSVFQYTLSTAYDISSSTYDSKSLDASSEVFNPSDIAVSSDGAKIYIYDVSTNKAFQYTMSVPYDISTASYDNKSLDASSQTSAVTSFMIEPNGGVAYVVGNSNDTIFEYLLSVPFDLSTATYSNKSFLFTSQTSTTETGFIDFVNNKIYVVGGTEDLIFQYTMPSSSYGVDSAITNQYFPAITNASGQIDTSLWLDIDDMTVTDIQNTADVLYAISNDNKTTFKIRQTTLAEREIARLNASTWEYNSSADYAIDTWTAATVNSSFGALSQAMSVTVNQMTGAELEALVDAEYTEVLDTLDLAIILHTNDAAVIPSSDGASVDYTASATYGGAINGTDYEWEKISDTSIKITALTAGNYNIRAV